MNRWRTAALPSGLLLVAMVANATSPNDGIRIKALDSETRWGSLAGSGVLQNCGQVNFDAFCNIRRDAILTNALLVHRKVLWWPVVPIPKRIHIAVNSKYCR